MHRHRLPPFPDLAAAVDVEDASLSELRPAASRAAATSSPAGTSSATAKARSCRTAGYVITSSYTTARGRRRATPPGRARTRSTRPRAVPVQLAQPPFRQTSRLAGVEELVRRRLVRRLRLDRGVERLDDALRAQKTSLEHGRDPGVLVGQAAFRQVAAADLEQRNPLRSCGQVASRRLEQARQERCAEHGELGGDRLEQPKRADRDPRPAGTACTSPRSRALRARPRVGGGAVAPV